MIPPDIWNTKDSAMVALLSNLKNMVRQIKMDEQQGAVIPYWLDLKLLTGGGRRAIDTDTIIKRYSQDILSSVIADFVTIGHEAQGSRALVSTKSGLFTSALNAFLDIICAVVNRFAIPELLAFNGVSPELTPTLAHGDVENVPIEALGAYIGALAQAGMQLFPSPTGDLEEALLQAAKLPTTGVLETAPGLEENPAAFETREAETSGDDEDGEDDHGTSV